ncbi:MAG: winged helix-turn-helix transcriptional regulator [Lachnospiraceae bacterium]|nr:winged helix-turn-helix transcriptional regulator [Lachnospiraceae bacterium]
MLHLNSLDEGLEIFKALGSEVRVQIINILLEESQISMNQLASRLNLSNGALTGHIKKLEEAGLISTSNDAEKGHGNQKICSILVDKILVEIEKPKDFDNVYSTQVSVGHYSRYDATPTCGLANSKNVIGELDDARYFDHPDRFTADILWLTKGFVEYTIPNLIPAGQQITQISISAELSSEAPGYNNDWPSDISFYINDTYVGTWTSPGDFGDVKGLWTPDWWEPYWNQYGLLKLLVVNQKGTFIDGLKISEVSTDDLKLDSNSTIRFRLAVDEHANHVGGLCIYGKSFGNYEQDIKASLYYKPL